jgi:hypothetical protein
MTLRHILQFDFPKDWDQATVGDFFYWLSLGETLLPEIEVVRPGRRNAAPGEEGDLDLTIL